MKNKCRCCACKGQPTLTTGCSLPPVFRALRIRFKIIKHFFSFFKFILSSQHGREKFPSLPARRSFLLIRIFPTLHPLVQFSIYCFSAALFIYCFYSLLFTHMLMHHTFQSITHLWKKLSIKTHSIRKHKNVVCIHILCFAKDWN